MGRLRLVFDVNIEGFRRWVRRRLRYLGITAIKVPSGMTCCDRLIAEYAERLGAVVVTRDRRFPYKNKIVLTSTKYEKMWVELCRGLRERAMSRAAGSIPNRGDLAAEWSRIGNPDMPRRR